ncbi:MAG: hypothetical protein OXI95_12635 [bacterium]|nr:hypothetical protein [bacterium]
MATQYTQYVSNLADRKIRGFQGTIDEHGEYLDSIYQSNRSLSASIASDYRDRFLLELIQNAYDAHLIGTQGGQIELTLDKSAGRAGTLLVANGGRPFAEANVKSLCDIGLSQKPLGESIGNKGLGFRSVVQITDAPVIYSQCLSNPEKSHFSGFCFRFAGTSDYQEMISDAAHLRLALRDLPIFHVPVWVERQSEVIRGYAAAGFSSVIELPLRDSDALDAAEREINHLAEQNVPILLFLDRISALTVRIVGSTGLVEREFVFIRNEESITTTGIRMALVNLGEVGRFLVAREIVPEATMKKAIKVGIKRKELNEYWVDWAGEGDVAVAVRLGSNLTSSRLYAFLPLGEQAVAPFLGYLHGSFAPSSNRRNLNAGITLNSTLLMTSAKLAAETIHYIITDPLNTLTAWLAEKERATAVVDLLSWTNVSSVEGDDKLIAELTQDLAKHFAVDRIEQAPVVPCLMSGTDDPIIAWQPPAQVRRWPDGGSVFSADECVRFAPAGGVWPIWGALGERIDTLEEFLQANTDCYVGPPRPDERAWLVSMIAGTIVKRRRGAKAQWLRFFHEIPDFMHHNGDHLGGREVLLGDDGELHRAMSPDAVETSAGRSVRRRRRTVEMAVFSPPDPRRASNDDENEVRPPKKLSKRFTFLSSTLPWHGELSSARSYFEKHKLVGEFERETILAHLSRTLHGENNREVLRGGLRWAFQLWRQPRAQGRTFKLQPQHRFRVPVVGGKYVEAHEVVFSADWPAETEGRLVQDFLDAAPTGLPDLDNLSSSRLAAPDHPAFRGRWIDDWVVFLAELGVNRGLVPESRSSNANSFVASKVSDFTFLKHYGIPSKFGDLWREDIVSQNPDLLQLPTYTDYAIEGEVSWLPGQADIDDFSGTCKARYARLIMGWLLQRPKVQWDIDIHHLYFHQADRRKWPSPIRSFLRAARWLPVVEPSRSSLEAVGVKPSDVWISNTGGERFESYLRRPPRELRRYIERSPDELVHRLAEHCELRILDDPAILHKQLEFLAETYTRGEFDSHFEPHLLNRYYRTWRLLVRNMGHGDQEANSNDAPVTILARRGQAIERVALLEQDEEIEECVYVCDTNRESDASLLEVSGRLFFSLKDVEPDKLGMLFESCYGQRIRRVSQVSYELLVDGNDIRNAKSRAAVDICPQLRSMLAIGMEALGGTEAQRLPTDRSTVLTRLDRLTMTKAARVGFTIDGMDVSTDQDTACAFHFRFDNGQSVVAVQSSREWDWELVDVCIPAVCEAVGHRALTPHLRLLVAHLRNGQAQPESLSRPVEDIQSFSNILQLSPSASFSAHATLSAGLERQAPWIRAVLHLLVGPSAVEAFDRESDEVLMDASC